MTGRLILELADGSIPLLRSIEAADLEDLRRWKNDNRQAFFFKDEITAEGQKKWYQGYLGRPNDYMFIVQAGTLRAGCVAFRLENGYADEYNIIASPEGRGQGHLKTAMRLMNSYVTAEHTRDVGLQVVVGNPAKGFYESCGFTEQSARDGFHQMRLSTAFSPLPYRVRRA
ncbi:MAG: GNAT family N-acetyltransferase [Elusimicrobia bacterium]|nr:GNAT family N-acetyltransferase [Elusimicrobiota bacterium]